MPPRFAYWTILAGGLPTSFRAADRADLLPTFERIRHTHPDAEMKWFARGKLWSTPAEAQAALRAERRPPPGGRDWRPGGSHRDPRKRFADAKKARNAALRKKRFERKQAWTGPAGQPSGLKTDPRAPRTAQARQKPPGSTSHPPPSGKGRRGPASGHGGPQHHPRGTSSPGSRHSRAPGGSPHGAGPGARPQGGDRAPHGGGDRKRPFGAPAFDRASGTDRPKQPWRTGSGGKPRPRDRPPPAAPPRARDRGRGRPRR